jgi:hypothetical protein
MKLVVGLLSVVALAFATPAAADAPTEFGFQDVFDEINPCTGAPMIVTIVGAASGHEHGSRFVGHAKRTISTSDGFSGRGTDAFIGNGQVVVFRFADMMTNASGDRFRAQGVFVLDLSIDTVRVDRFALTCLGG